MSCEVKKLSGCNKQIIRWNLLQTQFLTLKDVNLMLMLSVWTHFDGTHSQQNQHFASLLIFHFPHIHGLGYIKSKTVSDVEKLISK